MRHIRLLLVSIMVVLVACSAQDAPVQQRCSTNVDCLVPVDYAIRSHCPYEGVCINSSCEVACFQTKYVPDILVDEKQQVTCESAAECDCNHYDNIDFKYCACLAGRCAAVVDYNLLLGRNNTD